MEPEWGSDVIAETLRRLDIEYVAMNPGASFRGVHDSFVNYLGNTKPEMIICSHEEISVAIAHGYGRAAGKPMAAFTHDIVGLLHASMAMFNAWLGRDAVLVLGGTGPVDANHRRPWIDWIHTANVQGNAVRDFVKWDDQPASVGASVESLIRAYNLCVSEPRGPVYVCFDTDVQEQKLDAPFVFPVIASYPVPTPLAGDPAAIRRTGDLLLGARKPVILANQLGRSEDAVEGLKALAEALAIPVITGGDGFSFPTRHSLYATEDKDSLLEQADVVVAFDVYDLEQLLTRQNWATRTNEDILPPGAKLVDVSLRHLTVKSWADDHGRLYPTELSVAADVALALPALADEVRSRVNEANADEIEARRTERTRRRSELRTEAIETAERQRAESPVALSTLAADLWEVVKDEDWVLGNGDLRGWLDRLWDFDAPFRNRDGRGGAGLGQGLGHAIGVALANRAHGRLTINVQSDGDFLFTPAAIWTAVHHRIPILIVMYNNRTYGNDLGHQGMMARVRNRPEENKTVGINIDDPVVDFAAMARSMGAWAEGPIERAEDVRGALERAKHEVLTNGRVALVDVVTQVN